MVRRREVWWAQEQSGPVAYFRDGQGYPEGFSKVVSLFDSSWARMVVSAASAAMDRVMCRYQAS